MEVPDPRPCIALVNTPVATLAGANLTITDSVFINNSANYYAGGILGTYGIVETHNVTMQGNKWVRFLVG